MPPSFLSLHRKRHPISMVKAKEALAKSNLDVEQALIWLERDLQAGGAAKQAKLAGRVASEGLIAVGVMGEGWGRRGGIVEVSFVLPSFPRPISSFLSPSALKQRAAPPIERSRG